MHIVLLGRMAAVLREGIAASLHDSHTLTAIPDARAAGEHLPEFERADVIVGGPLTREVVERARRLKLFQAPRAGLDNLGLEWLPPHVPIANTFHHETSIAEYVLMAMLLLARQSFAYDRELRRGNWDGSCIWGEPPTLRVLEGATLLILGRGHIASEVIRRAGAFGMRTVAVSRSPAAAAGAADLVVGYEHWRDRLPEADFLVPCCPLTEETRGLIGSRELAAMPREGCLINIARAEIVDEAALYQALRQRRIAGAALDVWYRYPSARGEACFPSQYPFHELPNVLLTPHVSGWTRQTVAGRARDVAGNINRLAMGEPLRNIADRALVAGRAARS